MDWKEQYADKTLSLEAAAGKVAPDSTVLVGMGVGIPYALLNAVTVSGIGFTLYAASVSSPVKAYLPPYNRRIAVKNCFFGPVERASMISKYGKETGVPTPANDLITKMVSAIQRNYAKQYQEESK